MAGPVRTRRPSVKKIVVGGNFFPPASSIPIEPQKMKRLTACLKECCMMKRTLSALMLSGALLCALSVPALAAEPAAPQTGTSLTQEETLPDSVLYYGTVTEVVRDEDGTVSRLALSSERYGDYVMNLSADAVWVDAGKRTASDPSDLEAGEAVYVFHSPVSTRSLPPQSAAYAVVRNMPQDMGCPMYHEVEAVTEQDGRLTITTDNGGLLLHVNEETQCVDYATGKAVDPAHLKEGGRVMAWYDIVLTSYPGQAGPSCLMLLPEVEEQTSADQPAEATELADGTALSIVLEGDMVLPVKGSYENGAAMVPVAAAAKALGYEVTYTPGQDGAPALVTVESETFRVNLTIGQEQITGVTKIEGAAGMTSPMKYGAAPRIEAPGTTWAPAQLFEMLGRTVTLEGDTLSIQ